MLVKTLRFPPRYAMRSVKMSLAKKCAKHCTGTVQFNDSSEVCYFWNGRLRYILVMILPEFILSVKNSTFYSNIFDGFPTDFNI